MGKDVKQQFTTDSVDNSYWQGSDTTLYENGKYVATIGIREDRPAICVKSYQTVRDSEISQGHINAIYEDVVHTFWHFSAPRAAEMHGYSEVFSAGNSGGWLITDAREFDARFFRFAQAITELVSDAEQTFSDELAQAETELSRARKAAIQRSNN